MRQKNHYLLVGLLLSASCASLYHNPKAFAQDARFVRIVSKSVIKQHTRNIILQWEKYMKASAADKDAYIEILRNHALKRAEGLDALLKSDPNTVHAFKLPPEIRETLPAEFQPLLEHQVELTGVVRKDNNPDPGSSVSFPYTLRDGRGKTYQLYRTGVDPVFAVGAKARVSGILFDKKLLFEGGSSGGFEQLANSLHDNTPPKIKILQPTTGQVVREELDVLIEAKDNTSVTHVDIFHDGKVLAILNSEPWEYTWNTKLELDGPHTLVAKAYDPDLNVSATQSLTLMIDNTAPRAKWLSPPRLSNITDSVQLQAQASDNIGIESVKLLVDGVPVGVAVAPPYIVEWDSTSHSNGDVAFQALAIDRAGNVYHSDPVVANLVNENSAPIIQAIQSRTINEATAVSISVQANDPDGARDSLSFSSSNFPEWLNFDPKTKLIYGTPPFDTTSHEEPSKTYSGMIIEVCDAQPLCASQNFTIRVVNVNHPPSISGLMHMEYAEGDTIDVTPFINDPDGDPVNCEIRRRPVFIQFDEETCNLTGEIPFDIITRDMGSYDFSGIKIVACDPQELCVSSEFVITVVDVNQKPEISLIRDARISEGQELLLEFEVLDKDGDPIFFEVMSLPRGALFQDYGGGTATLKWTPESNQAGSYPITLTASDDIESDTQVFSIVAKEAVLSFSGRVLDDLEKAVPGVSITYSRTGNFKYRATTDANGYYIAKDIKPGTYTLRPEFGIRDNLPTSGVIHFQPLSTRIELRSKDINGVDFTALGFQ